MKETTYTIDGQFAYQSDWHCSKTEDARTTEEWQFAYQSGWHCSKTDKVRDTDGTLRQLKLMSEVTGIKAIAGAGASKKIRDVKRLCKKYGGSSLKWRKMRGTAIIDDGGIDYKVELHWYNKVGGIRVYEVKIKRYLY
ncbi:hypothetical protein [Tractidigestivibacter sp.]|uniref:hypothetical protein n=1 Tax=Tractidigestivibacter sp. TaxID=2847320 RepID=UPI002A7EF445|nr:hypothetical protein [Tractidigestivibacter sp.]MDD7583855.1 hypothetical protein [Coriobacteriaceae bacterium]MDY4535041.1 hypothetical protein [Tractidigestivibacter sp.]MDY5271090.1 hypothetical protein [Tractidigestivibacter sp.]